MLVSNVTDEFMKAEAERRRQKQMERAAEDRVLDPWERYRTLNDHCDRLLDVNELYDRKTRFALLILGGLNAINLLIAARADLTGSIGNGHVFVPVYISSYAVLSLWLLARAISALRPQADLASTADALEQSLDDYSQQWKQAQIGQVNHTLVSSAYTLIHANAAKTKALRGVYLGLYVLAALTAGLVVVRLSGVF
jgi:hypothetical protein